MSEKFRIFSGNFTNKSIFQANLRKISIFSGNFTKKIRFCRQFYWLFTAISGQIILFLFKSHHFRTHFLYKYRYPRPPRPSPHDPLSKIWGGRDPNPPGLTPMRQTDRHTERET